AAIITIVMSISSLIFHFLSFFINVHLFAILLTFVATYKKPSLKEWFNNTILYKNDILVSIDVKYYIIIKKLISD
ncbi:hypothetical protein, partial [Anaerosporobacter sp.]